MKQWFISLLMRINARNTEGREGKSNGLLLQLTIQGRENAVGQSGLPGYRQIAESSGTCEITEVSV